MKIKRYKKVQKNLNFYINNFAFRQPYQLLVDGTFCLAALNNQINIADNISRYLHGELKLLTTQCAIIEMENLGVKLGGALLILKKYGIHKCGHESKAIPASRCLLSMIGKCNENHYIIASQDRDLQDKIRKRVGVPMLYLHGRAPVLEQPSEVSVSAVKNKMIGVCADERKHIEQLKNQSGLVKEENRPRKKRKKGPNPLSCKKKKVCGMVMKNSVSHLEKEKKKRKKIRIPEHVKKELLKK